MFTQSVSQSITLLTHFCYSRTDKEIFDEIMNDAIAEIERNKSLQKARKSNGQGSKSSSQKASRHKAPVSNTAVCDSQETSSCSQSNCVGPPPTPLQAASPVPRPAHLPPSSQRDCEIKQTEEKKSNEKDDKYPMELDTFGEKASDDRQSSLPSENASDLFKTTPVKNAEVCVSTPGKGLCRSDGLISDKTCCFSVVEASSNDKETTMKHEQSLPKSASLNTLAPSEVHPKSLVEASQSKRETLFNKEEGASCTTDPDASTPSEAAGFSTVVHGAMLEGSTVPRKTESSDIFQIKPPQSKVFIYCRYKSKRFHSLSRIIQ